MESSRPMPGSSSSRCKKPDVDFIDGLSPAISIEQKSAPKNPRSTVGTMTEIYDYLAPALRPHRRAALPQLRRDLSHGKRRSRSSIRS